MRPKDLKQLCGLLIVTAVLSLAASGQTTSITLEQSQGSEIPLLIGSPAHVDITAQPGMNYALLAARQTSITNTPVGTLEIDLADPDFQIGIDGFNPAHHLFSWGFVDNLGQFGFDFLPYQLGAPTGQRIYLQTVAQDPTAGPFNLRLSNTVGSRATPLVPRVDSVTPRSVSFGDIVTIQGDFFTGSLTWTDTPMVSIGDGELTVLTFDDETITAVVNASVHSGEVRVHSDVGSSPSISYDPNHYVVVLGIYTTEMGQGTTPMDGHHSLRGTIDSTTDVDTYTVTLTAGEELFVEVFNYDAANDVVLPYSPANWTTTQLNSTLELVMPGVPIDPIIADNDGGPGFAAGIGVVTAARFQAPYSGDYTLRVQSAFNVTQGDYVFNTWTRPADLAEQPELIGVHPNYVFRGQDIEIYATGLDLSNPAGNIVEFPGPNDTWIQVPMYVLSNGHIGAIMPMNAISGHLRVTNPSGYVSSFDADDFPSFFMIQGYPNPESQVFAFSSSQQIFGNIATTGEVDNYQITVQAGQKVTARAFLFDPATNRLLKGRIFETAYLDPEIRIQGLGNGPIYAIDTHSGPGTAAEIGGLSVPPWTVQVSATYELSVRPWFALSSGDYILDIVIE